MRTLVTGASGFVGGALYAELIERGHEVSASGVADAMAGL
jgi:uncharacterized protein YbjT (DUF2867 family)